jgi:mono/diheme cytochrome c family protein
MRIGCVAVIVLSVLAGSSVAMAQGAPTATKGATLYRSYCAQCHGPNMVSPGTGSFDLRKFPPDQEERFYQSIIKGKNNMPAWGDTLKQDEIAAIWAYVRAGRKP